MKKVKHGINKIKKIDYALLIVVLIMAIFGTIAIFSATSATTVLKYNVVSSYFFRKQVLWICLGLIGGFLLYLLPKGWSILYGLGGLIAFGICLVIVFASGHIAGNAASWIAIKGKTLQPAEFIKPCMIVFMAIYYEIISKYLNCEELVKELQRFLLKVIIIRIVRFVRSMECCVVL